MVIDGELDHRRGLILTLSHLSGGSDAARHNNSVSDISCFVSVGMQILFI